MRVMIVVTHLLGTGHLARAVTLARAYRAAGDDVCIVSGGMPAPMLAHGDIELVQLAPARSDGVNFARLLGADGHAVTPQEMAQRQAALIAHFTRFAPDVLLTELFPFGRRILRDEFRALLETAQGMQNPPLVCASVRDILAPPSKPAKAEYAEAMIAQFYDAVLVHSDQEALPLELSWPVTPALAPLLHYTGFVAPPAAGPHPQGTGAGEIIVSAGGGDVGGPVYQIAAAAAQHMRQPMRLLVGGADPAGQIAHLRAQAPDLVMIEPARPDFRQMLTQAAASVSLCGYNTALDILQAGTPSVFIPFDEGGEVEQGLRARALAHSPAIVALARGDLTVQTLCAALEQVLTAPRPPVSRARFNGAARTVALTRSMRRLA
jgi:predicted glycosyltransferase